MQAPQQAIRTVVRDGIATSYGPGDVVIAQQPARVGPSLLRAALDTAERLEKEAKEADANGQLLADINAYLAKLEARKSEYTTWGAFFAAGRSFFGGYSKTLKRAAATYLKDMVMHFMLHDKKLGSTETMSLEDKIPEACGRHLGPLSQGELGGLFTRYLKCSSKTAALTEIAGHYHRYQVAATRGEFTAQDGQLTRYQTTRATA